jgi:hypothetical protein
VGGLPLPSDWMQTPISIGKENPLRRSDKVYPIDFPEGEKPLGVAYIHKVMGSPEAFRNVSMILKFPGMFPRADGCDRAAQLIARP